MRPHAERSPGDIPCLVTGEAHIIDATRRGRVWHHRCEQCGEEWETNA